MTPVGEALRIGGSAKNEFDWLFNHNKGVGADSIATVRFFAGHTDRSTCGLVAVGETSCTRLVANLATILRAFARIAPKPEPVVNSGTVYWERRFPETYRVNKLILRDKALKLSREDMAKFHDEPNLLAPYIPKVIARGIEAQCAALGLDSPQISPNDITVLKVDGIGSQPLSHKPHNPAILPRITQAWIQLPLKLVGDWSVGPLLTYGNGRLCRHLEERQYRPSTAMQAGSMSELRLAETAS